MVNKYIFLLALVVRSHAYEYQCNDCTCYYAEPTILMDCSHRGLDSLPILREIDTARLTAAILMSNNITLLDENVLESWALLGYIDLRENPLLCTEIGKLKDGIEILTDCIKPTKGKCKMIIYLLKFSILMTTHCTQILNAYL